MEIKKLMDNGYYITTKGKVLDQAGNEMKLTYNKSTGYMTFKGKGVHRLVAIAFLPNPEDKPIVNHIDHDRTNNDIKNLEWTTHKENSNRTILQTVSYKLFKEVYEVYGDQHLSDIFLELLGRK